MSLNSFSLTEDGKGSWCLLAPLLFDNDGRVSSSSVVDGQGASEVDGQAAAEVDGQGAAEVDGQGAAEVDGQGAAEIDGLRRTRWIGKGYPS